MAFEIHPDFREEIERYVRSQFADGVVSCVRISPAYDFDDDIVLNVEVEFNAKPDTRRLRSFARSAVSEAKTFGGGFPVFSFASRNPLVSASA